MLGHPHASEHSCRRTAGLVRQTGSTDREFGCTYSSAECGASAGPHRPHGTLARQDAAALASLTGHGTTAAPAAGAHRCPTRTSSCPPRRPSRPSRPGADPTACAACPAPARAACSSIGKVQACRMLPPAACVAKRGAMAGFAAQPPAPGSGQVAGKTRWGSRSGRGGALGLRLVQAV